MKIISTIFNSIFILLLLGVAGLFLAPLLPIQNNIQIKIVESGSMEPAIQTGSLVVVKPSSVYGVGDVITFKSSSSDVPTTHRVASIEGRGTEQQFITKGDANEEVDTETTSLSAVLGKIVIAVPYAGYVLDFARQPIGFALLIVLPALVVILGEIEKIWTEVRRKKNNTHRDKDDGGGGTSALLGGNVKPMLRMIEIGHPIVIEPRVLVRHLAVTTVSMHKKSARVFGEVIAAVLIAFMSIGFTSLSFIGSTVSYFNDTELSALNSLQASSIDFTVLADGSTYNFLGTELDDEDGAVVSVFTPEEGSMDALYGVHIEKIEGSDLFCSAIVAAGGSPVVYNGPLLLLEADNVSFVAPWTLAFSLDELVTGYLQSDECAVDIVYTATNADGETGDGYNDEERIHLEFYAPALVQPLLQSTSSFEPLQSTQEEVEVPTEEETIPEPVLPQEPVEQEEIQEPELEEQEEDEDQTGAEDAVTDEENGSEGLEENPPESEPISTPA